MSSDTYSVIVRLVEGSDVVMEVKPTTASGLCDMSITRSFVLTLLRERGASVEPAQTNDQQWVAAHIDRFVTGVKVEQLVGMMDDGSLRELAALQCIPVVWLQPRATLRATMASPALAGLFRTGERFGTTGFDVWWDDPLRPAMPPPDLAAVPRWDSDPELASRVGAVLGAKLGGWRAASPTSFVLPGPDAELVVELQTSTLGLRSALDVAVMIDVPAVAALPSGSKPREKISRRVAIGSLAGPRIGSWFREWAQPSTDTPDLRFFEDEEIEPHAALADRIALELTRPEAVALTTREGLLGLFESSLAGLPPKSRPADFERFPVSAAPALSGRWTWNWSFDPFWKRVAVHAALGDREHARAALAQAQGRWKKAPKEYAAFIASLASG